MSENTIYNHQRDLSILDRDVSLGQELNLSPAPAGLSENGAIGGLHSDRHSSDKDLKPEEALAIAIVAQAAEDWRKAMGLLRRFPDHKEAEGLRKDVERFFRSRWFRTLVDLDGEEFLARLKAEQARLSLSIASSDSSSSPLSPAALDTRRKLENHAHKLARRRSACRAKQQKKSSDSMAG